MARLVLAAVLAAALVACAHRPIPVADPLGPAHFGREMMTF